MMLKLEALEPRERQQRALQNVAGKFSCRSLGEDLLLEACQDLRLGGQIRAVKNQQLYPRHRRRDFHRIVLMARSSSPGCCDTERDQC